MKNDDIAAISTAAGAAGVAVIRISGRDPLSIAEKAFRPAGKTAVADFIPNMMYAGEIDAGDFSDFGLCVYEKGVFKRQTFPRVRRGAYRYDKRGKRCGG